MMLGLRGVLGCASLALAAGCAEIPGFPRGKPAPEPATPPPSTTPAKPPSPEAINEAFSRLNRAFQREYERIIAERGRRTVAAKPREAFDAMHAGLMRLGMIVESQDPVIGTLSVAAPAPRPLTLEGGARWSRRTSR